MKRIVLLVAIGIVSLFGSEISLKKYFNDETCDRVLENDGFFKTCYNYENKGAKYVSYTLKAENVNAVNIKERPRFYDDMNIPKKYRSSYSDYTHNIYNNDRGHLFEDAAADWSEKSLKSAYTMSNIIPQHESLNRSIHAWKGLEKYGRTIAVKMGSVDVLNGVEYGDSPRKMGKNQISVPEAFWKIYYNKDQNFQRCFYFKNKAEVKGSNIRDYEVECSKLIKR